MEVGQLQDRAAVLQEVAGCDGVGAGCFIEGAGGVSGVLLGTSEGLGFFREIVHGVAEVADTIDHLEGGSW